MTTATRTPLRHCDRPGCSGQLLIDAETEELTCLLCGRTPAPKTGAETSRLSLITKGVSYGRFQS